MKLYPFLSLLTIGVAAHGAEPLSPTHADRASPDSPPPASAPALTSVSTADHATPSSIELLPAEALAFDADLTQFWRKDFVSFEKSEPLLREAQIAAKANNFPVAEQRFIVALARRLTDKERHDARLQLAHMYERSGQVSKALSQYEKFKEEFPRNSHLPLINLHLGRLYRQIGAHNLAQASFYQVLNATLNIDPDRVELYRDIANLAKLEIAETHFLLKEYPKAIDLFKRLERLDLGSNDLMEIRFRLAYSYFLTEQYASALPILRNFLSEYPESRLVPESWYLLANTHKQLQNPDAAIDAVLRLLNDPHTRSQADKDTWLFWQKRAANQLANELYEQGDFMNSLRVYMRMSEISDDPEWLAPVLYQIGLCHERLRTTDRAIRYYDQVISGEPWKDRPDFKPSEPLLAVQEMAAFRKKHLEWSLDTEKRLNEMMARSASGT